MRRRQCVGDLTRDLERAIHRQGSAGEVLGERRPFDKLHHERADPIGNFETVNRRDVRVIERRKQTCLSLQSRNPFSVDGERGGQDFDRDVTRQPGVARAIDFTHRARIERPQDYVRPELDARSQCGSDRRASICGRSSEPGDGRSLSEPFSVSMRGKERLHVFSER